MEMREEYPSCQWHSDPAADTADRMLLRYTGDPGVDRSPLFTRLETDLTECFDCIEVYHEARDRLVNDPLNEYYNAILVGLEQRRVRQSLNQETEDEAVLFRVIHEVTEHPFLLFNQEIEFAYCSKLKELNNGLEAFLPHHVPSMYLLVVHPDSKVRELAWQCLQQPKHHITSDLYDEISLVLSWVLNSHFAGCLDEPAMQLLRTPSEADFLPPHLFCARSRIPYWQGVTRLFEIMSEDALKHRFLNSQSHKQFVPVLIDTVSIHDEGPSAGSPFWQQVQCLTCLMDKLGSSVWQDVPKSKIEGFFDIITKHPMFLPALEARLDSNRSSTSVAQSSLLVDSSEPFQWIVPYIKSLVDFGESVSDNFCVVITFLCSKLSGRGYSDTGAGLKMSSGKPPDPLIEKLMLALVRVLECLQKNSLLGTLVGKTPQWLKVLLAFLKQHPPVSSRSDVSRLVALSHDSRQLLIDVFSHSRKHGATIVPKVKYIKMLSLPLPLSAAQPGSSSAQGVDLRKLWEVNLKGKEFSDCVKFVEETLQIVPRPQRLDERNDRYQLLDSSKQPLMSTPINLNPHGPKQLPLNTKHPNASGSCSPPPSEHLESVISPEVPSRQPRRNLIGEFAVDLKPSRDEHLESVISPEVPSRHPRPNLIGEFAVDLKPSRDELMGVDSDQESESILEENEFIQISSEHESDPEARTIEDQTPPNSSKSTADKGCSAKYKPLLSSDDELALISDFTEAGDTSSSLEDILGTPSIQIEPKKEGRQIKTEGGTPRVVPWRRSRVLLRRVPELEELDRSIKQVRITSTNPLVIEKVEPNSWTRSPERSSNKETSEDMASSYSDRSESFNGSVFSDEHKQEKIRKEVREEKEVSTPSCSYPLAPRRHFMSSSSSSLSGTPSPKSRHSSIKYPKNRLSLTKRNKRTLVIASSSDDEEVATQIFNPDTQETKQPLKIKEDAMRETCDDQDQEFVTTDDRDDQEEEMELSDSILSCCEDNSEGRKIYINHSDKAAEIAEVAQESSFSGEEMPGGEGVSSLIAGDADDEAMEDLRNSSGDDSECSQSLLRQSDPQEDVPSPGDSTFSKDRLIDDTNVCNEDKPTTSQDERNNSRVSPDDHTEEVTSISDVPDEDTKPISRFIKIKLSSPNSYDDSSMLSFTEDHQEDDAIIDLESYNSSQLFDEDVFSQITPCIEISSDSEIDLDASEPELNIDLAAVKKEREDSDQDELGTERCTLPESRSENSPDFGLHDDNDIDMMYWSEEEDSNNDGDDERGENDVNEEGEDNDQDSDDSVFMFENVSAETVEREEEIASTEQNDKLTPEVFYSNKVPPKGRFSDTVPTARRFGLEKETTGLTWKSLEAKAVSKNEQKKIKGKKRKMTQDKQRHGLAGQGASKLASTQKWTVRVIRPDVDAPSTSGQPVAAPRVPGSRKPGRQQQPLESTPTDAEPMKTIGSSEQTIVTETYALEDSQSYRRHKPTNQQDDKSRAAVQSVDRFKSRNSILTQEIKKGETGQKDGMAKTRHSSGGHDVGASKVRHDSLSKGGGSSRKRNASSPLSVIQPKRISTLPSSNSGEIDQLPIYAQSVYNNKSSIPADIVSATGKSVPSIRGATEPSCSDARLTNPEHVEPVVTIITSPLPKGSSQSSPSGESSSAIPVQDFRFFTSDPNTMRTAATLSSEAANRINKNDTTSQAPRHTQNPTGEKVVTDHQPQTSRQPVQRSKSYDEEIVAGGPLPPQAAEVHAQQGKEFHRHPSTSQPLQRSSSYSEGMVAGQAPPVWATEVSARPRLVLQGNEAVKLSETRLSEEDFYCWVIGWDSRWLDICGPDAGRDHCPAILAECPYKTVRNVPLYFDSAKDYYQVFIPLLLHEVWAQIQSRVNSGKVVPAIFAEVRTKASRQTGFLLSCTFRVTAPIAKCPVSCTDLLRISPSDTNAFCQPLLLAVVTNVMPTPPNLWPKVSDPSHQAELKSWDISSLILAKNGDINQALQSTVKNMFDLKVIRSLSPTLRQFKALISLPKLGIIASDILRFRRMDVFCPGPAPKVPTLEFQVQLNKRQMEAVSVAFQAITQPDTLPRICLIQGPPGTGKTEAVLELVTILLRHAKRGPEVHHSGNRQQGSRPPKAPPILLCAPSDTAIDVLVRRLMCTVNKVFPKGDSPCTIVRVGSPHLIHPTIRHIELESRVRSQRAGERSNNSFRQATKKNMAKLLQNQILELGKKCGLHKMRGEDTEFSRVQAQQAIPLTQLKIALSEIKDLQRQQVELDRKPNGHYEVDIMNNADIVCCTVNGCGSKQLYRNTDGKLKMMKFSCVIMDAANQCSELDSIISLQNCSMKVVLVGDTQSQPAPVSSKIARDHGLHQSLFQRLYCLFDRAKGTRSPVHYLQTQLRMHPAISQFPSKHFYRGDMVNDKKMAQMRQAFFLHPYLFFNVSGGQEVPTSSSFRNFTNKEEADLVQAICIEICKEKRMNDKMVEESMTVGVTTPYLEQVQCLGSRVKRIQEEIRRCFPREFILPTFEVSPLDLFQGREKDVMILSCVRASGSSDHSTLGLLGDKRVLNVFLTRARYSLFIVGHLPTLETNSDWNTLATDARQRQLLIDVPLNEYNSAAQRCSKKKEELPTNTEITTRTEPSVAPQLQTGLTVAPSAAASTGMKSSYVPQKMVESSLVGSKHGFGPKAQVDPRQTAVASTSTPTERGSTTSGANATNTNGDSTVHWKPKQRTTKSNIASPGARKSPSKKKSVRFQESNNQAVSQKSIQSLTPKPMQLSSGVQSPTKHNPYSAPPQSKSQSTASYNNLGVKRRSSKNQKGNQHSRPVVRVPNELRRDGMQPVAAQTQPSVKTTNKSSTSQGKTPHLSPGDQSKIAEQCAPETVGEGERQNRRSTSSKSRCAEQCNQEPVTGDSNGSHRTHLPGSSGYAHYMNRMTANSSTGPSGMDNVSTHPKRTISSPATSPSSEVNQPSLSGSGQHGAAPNLQQTVDKITRNHANTKTTRALPGLQRDPRQRRRSKHEARTAESSNNDPVRIPYTSKEHTSFD